MTGKGGDEGGGVIFPSDVKSPPPPSELERPGDVLPGGVPGAVRPGDVAPVTTTSADALLLRSNDGDEIKLELLPIRSMTGAGDTLELLAPRSNDGEALERA